MKKYISRWMFTITLFFMNAIAFAQDTVATSKTETTTSNSSSSNTPTTADATSWFAQNWYWVAAGIVLLILIVAMSGKSKDKYRSSKTTVTRDNRGNEVRSSTEVRSDD